MPEQRPADMNGVEATRREFMKAIEEHMLAIACDAYAQQIDRELYVTSLGEAHERFFNSMKGATNVHRDDVIKLIDAEIGRQEKMYRSINMLGQYFDTVEAVNPDKILADAYWDHGVSMGCNVKIDGTRFYALPRIPCSTSEYVTLKQAPVPANLVMVNKELILMLPYLEEASSETRTKLNKLLDASGQVTEDGVKEPIRVRKNYLWVHSEEWIDELKISELMEKYGADAFMVGYPGRNIAIIYTGLEESIERLWKTMYFDWGEMWRRYSR